MKTKNNQRGHNGSLPGLLAVALLPVSAILFASSFQAIPSAAQNGFYPALPATATGASPTPAPTLGNYPDISIPLSTDTTVTPDAAPTTIAGLTVSTSTNFHGTLEGYPTTGVVRVTDAHPAGTYLVTVGGFAGSGVITTRTFSLTVTTPAICPEVNFAAPRNFGVGQHTYSVAVGDFNGDGKQDLATANEFSNNLSILLGDGAGHFGPATNFNANDGPKSVVVADFNADGKQDVAAANYFSGNVSLLLGDGAGHFSPATNLAQGSYSTSLAVGDFNSDTRPDLAVAGGAGLGTVAILLGDGGGHFTAPTNFTVGSYPESIALGDFNGDSNQDLAVANSDSDNVSILLSDGTGHFSPATNFAAGSQPYSIAVGDFNSDNKQDLAVAHYNSPNVSIFLGDGAGHFSPATNFGAGDSARSVAVGDFNGDGKQDLAVANSDSPNVSLLLGDGTGHFSAPINFLAGSGPISIAVGDFNGDSSQDLAVANSTSNNVSILLRNCTPRPAPTLTHFAVSAPQYALLGFQFYLSIAAKDQFNTTVTGYPGTMHFTASGLAHLPPNSPLPNGTGTFLSALDSLGYQTITVTDTAAPSITGTSNPVFVMSEQPTPPPTPQPTPTGTPPPTPTATATGTPIPTPPATPTPIPCVIASLRENFDAVTAPALPAGWHSSSVPGPASCAPGGICPFAADWLTSSTNPRSSPHCAFHNAPGCVTDSVLDTFSFQGLSGSFLQFYHSYNLEDGFDGAVLEISINGGPFLDFIAAGGSFLFGGYNGTIPTGFQSPIEGRQAWTGQSEGYVGAAATLPAAAWSQNVTLRFRLATDCITSSPGWRIDDVEVVFLIPCATPTPTPSPTPNRIVTNTNDNGPGSLRQALADAQNGDVIGFDPALNGQTISLTSGELVINQDITINGPGSDLLSVSRSQSAKRFRIIHIMPGHTVAIQGLTISGGRVDKFDPTFPGAGIFNEQGTLTIDSCTVSGNFHFYQAGGIYNTGTLTVSDSTIIGNSGGFGGGGISSSGMLTIMNSTVRNNTSGLPQGVGGSTGFGAGIENSGTATIVSSTIDHNTANGSSQGSRGGGIASVGAGSLTISNSTISQNAAGIAGGAIFGGGSITNCTINGNTASKGGGIYAISALQLGSTILNADANSANIFHVGGTVTSHGYNLSSDNGAGFLTAPGDQINTDPILGPLQDNGGFTFTHQLLTGSPAINAGDPNFTPPPLYDQRGPGYDRVFSGHLDVGSFEVQALAPTPTPTPARPLNLSTRMLVQTGDRVGIGGFIIIGGAPKQALLRGIGPSLGAFGVPNPLADPVMELHGPAGFTTVVNDNWRDTQATVIEATGLAPTNDLESAILVTLDPGAYTAIVRGKNDTSGVGLVEVYDLGPATSRLGNISTRAFVGTGGDVVIGGFILGGGGNSQIEIHGIGPSLAGFGVQPALADPTLELRDSNGALLAFNDNCGDSPLAPHPDKSGPLPINDCTFHCSNVLEACIDISLPPGLFTAILAGKNGGTGIGLVEIYNLN